MMQTATKTAPSEKQVNIPDYVRKVLDDPRAPKRVAESRERVERVRSRAREAMIDARNIVAPGGGGDADAWWRSPLITPPGGRAVTAEEPLRVLVAGGGLAGLIVAAACHAKGMRVVLFEQAGSYAPYGGPIQIQSNALRALSQINRRLFDEIVKAGTVTADRVSGLKIGYDAGNALAGRYQKGDWLVRFDTVGPALEAGLPPTVVVDRPVIQQIFVKHGFPAGTVRIRSRVASYDKLGEGQGVRATLEDGTQAYGDVLVGADGIWSSVRKQLFGLEEGAGGFAASGAAGGAINNREERQVARDTISIARQARRRYSGFTCYAALANHRASNIEDVSYQILLGKDKYFVSTDAGGERQQWFALIRTPAGGQDPDPTDAVPTPKLDRLRAEFTDQPGGDSNGDMWDGFALELLEATDEADVKRRDLYDGPPLLRDPSRWLAPWADGPVAIAGDAAHPMMPNLGQGGCQSCEDGFRLVEELGGVRHTADVPRALSRYSRVRVVRTSIIQGLAQLGSDLLIDFDKMMNIPIIGPFFLLMTQVSMPWVLRYLYTADF
ncbi:hypothetical protein KFE25_011061 [Diacronema lutheri]|nr:hypothetical protein KFE25_011061 [Diacronema lutheri]